MTFSPAVLGGFGRRREHLGAGVGDPDLVALDADLGQRERRYFLLLGGHDAFEGREARFVDLLGDTHHCGQWRLDGEHTVIGLALAGHLAALDGHFAQVGELRKTQVLGDDGRHRTADAVGGLVARDDQLGALDGAERTRQRPPGLDDVRTVHALVEQVHRLVGTHRQRLTNRLGGALGTGGQHRDGALGAVGGCLLLDQQGLFDGALVDLVEHGIGGLAVKGEVAVGQLALRPGIWDLFDQDHDVRHESGSSSSNGAAGRPANTTVEAMTTMLLVGNLRWFAGTP